MFADAEVVRYLGDGKPKTRDRVKLGMTNAALCWERHGFGPFTVLLDDDIVGDCLLYPIVRSGADGADFDARGPEIEIGYRLKRSAWGLGIATEAAQAVLDWALAPDGASLDEVLAVTYPENVASQRVLEKIGMRRMGETDRFYGATTVLYSSVG